MSKFTTIACIIRAVLTLGISAAKARAKAKADVKRAQLSAAILALRQRIKEAKSGGGPS
jgi:hypothetical protein